MPDYDLTLILTIAVFVAVGLTAKIMITLLVEIKSLKQIVKELIDINKKLRDTNKKYSQRIPQILRIIELNVDDISNIKQQMAQVHRWLGEVLNISNLIPNESGGISADCIIDELRQRVKWAEEIEEQSIDDKNYYKGD